MKRGKGAKGGPQVNAAVLHAFSAVVNRALLTAELGAQYGGDRNLYQALGYRTILDYSNFYTQYKRQDIAKAIINRPVKATWRGGFELVESDDDQETSFEKDTAKLIKDFQLSKVFARLDRLTGVGRYGVLLLGLSDVSRPAQMAQAVQGSPSLVYLKPLGEGSAKIDKWDKDTGSPRFNLPVLYDITLTDDEGTSTGTLKVHYSRILHVTEDLMESEVYGSPRLEAVYNRLMDLEKLSGGSAEMFWRGARPGYQGKVGEEFTLTDAMKDALQEQLDEFDNNLRRVLMNEGVEFEALATQVSSPKDAVDIQIQLISAETGIPKRILTGSEIGELASTADRDNWFDLIDGRRPEFAEGSIIRPFIDRMVEFNIIKPPKEEYSVKWSDLYKMSDKDAAEIGRIRATSVKEYASAPAASMILPEPSFLEICLGLDKDQIEIIGEQRDKVIREEENDFSPEETPDSTPDLEEE